MVKSLQAGVALCLPTLSFARLQTLFENYEKLRIIISR